MLVKSGYSMTEPPVHGLTQGEFRIGQTFGRAWKLFSANFWKFFIVTAISELPVRAYLRWGNAAGELLVGTTVRTIIMFLAFVLVCFSVRLFLCTLGLGPCVGSLLVFAKRCKKLRRDSLRSSVFPWSSAC